MHNPQRNPSRHRRNNSFTEGFLAGRISRLDPFARIPSIVPFGRRPLDPFSVSDLRFHWQRAENHVLAQLRAGVHPLLIQQYAEELISPDGIGTVYFRSVVRIIGNLVEQGRFEGLALDGLSVRDYLVMREVERGRFARVLRERFLGVGELGGWARDEEIEKCIARARSLDRKAEEELRELREEELRWAEEKYQATEGALRKALEEQEKRNAVAPQEDNRSKISRTSTAGPSIYTGGNGGMPAGYYGAQMAADSPQRGRTSTRQRDVPPTPPPKTSNHATVGSGRRPFSRRRDNSIPPTPPPKDSNNATGGRRGRSQARRETTPPANYNRHASRNNSRTRPSSRSRLGDWLQTNAALPIPQSEHFYSNHATVGSNSTTTGSRNRGPPPASMRGWDRVWSQTPFSLFGSQRRSRSHSSTRERDTNPSQTFSSQRRREGSRAREVSREREIRGSRSSSIPRARNLNVHLDPEPPRIFNNGIDSYHPPNFSRPRSVERGYRGTTYPALARQDQNQGRNQQHRNFSRPRTTPSRTHSQHPYIQTNGMFDPRDRIQTGFAETVKTESTRRGRDGVAYEDREVFGFRDPRDRIATGIVETVKSFRSRSKGPSLRRR